MTKRSSLLTSVNMQEQDPVNSGDNGRYILEKTENTQQYIDLIANYSRDFGEDISFNWIIRNKFNQV